MSGKAEQEPSIEEILASIRQIISDDDEPKRDAAVDLSATEEPVREPDLTLKADNSADASSFADVLELTNPIEDERKPEVDLSVSEDKYSIPSSPQPAPSSSSFANIDLDLSEQAEPTRSSDLDLSQSNESLFSSVAATATTQAFTKLIGNIPVEREENRTLYADGRITLEDIVKDMLRPMLREWINDHVPTIVERLVEKELEKLSRQVRD